MRNLPLLATALILTAGCVAAAELKIGVGTSVITPFLEQPLAGYYYARTADGVHDHLQAKALVFDDGIVTLANDGIGHIPTRLAFEQGSYEPTSTRLAPGAGELIVEKALELLARLK